MSLLIVIGIIFFIVFALLGVILLLGKGAMMIAGYNTMSSEERSVYDERKLTKVYGIFSISVGALILFLFCAIDTGNIILWILFVLSLIPVAVSVKMILGDYVKK